MKRKLLGRLGSSRVENVDPNAHEMSTRVAKALEESVALSEAAAHKALEAQQLFGSIRREIAVVKAREVKPK